MVRRGTMNQVVVGSRLDYLGFFFLKFLKNQLREEYGIAAEEGNITEVNSFSENSIPLEDVVNKESKSNENYCHVQCCICLENYHQRVPFSSICGHVFGL